MPYASKCYRWNGTQIILKPDECVGLIQRKEVEFTGWHSEANSEQIQATKTRRTNLFDIQQSIHLIYALALVDGSKNIELNSFWNLENYHRSVTRTNGIFLFGKRVGIGNSVMAKVVVSKKQKNLIWNFLGKIRNNSLFSIILKISWNQREYWKSILVGQLFLKTK